MTGIEKIRGKLAAGELCRGAHIKWIDNSISEALAVGGFDYIWVDGEHGSMALNDVLGHIRAAQGRGAAAFYRVPWNDPVLVKPVLDMGPDAVIFPMVNSADEARQAVASCRYPPHGVRGFFPGRAMGYGHMAMDDYLEAAGKIMVLVQIEHIDAVRNADAILEIEGIDGVIVGPADLSASMGLLGQGEHPRLLEVLESLCEKLAAAGMPFGTAVPYDTRVVKRWIDWGARMISVGGDEEFICRQTRETLQGMDRMFAETRAP